MNMGKMTDEEWNHLVSIGRLHNRICCGEEEQSSLNEYVIKHESELAHFVIVDALLGNVELTHEFMKEHLDYVNTVYRIAKKAEKEYEEGIFSLYRIFAFFELMKEFKADKVF